MRSANKRGTPSEQSRPSPGNRPSNEEKADRTARSTSKTPPSPDEKKLVLQAVSGNRTAFQKLYFKYHKLVTAIVYQKVSHTDDIEDLVQESFLKAWRSLPKLRDPDRFLPWLIRIVSHLATDWQRSRKRKAARNTTSVNAVLYTIPSHNEKDPGDRITQNEEYKSILEALKLLPEKQRIVLTMRFLEELTPSDIAKKLCEPPGTIRNRIFRGLKKLEKLVHRKTADEGYQE
jgi:RNA polymerase sigma-70 factor (ECF subfamily)